MDLRNKLALKLDSDEGIVRRGGLRFAQLQQARAPGVQRVLVAVERLSFRRLGNGLRQPLRPLRAAMRFAGERRCGARGKIKLFGRFLELPQSFEALRAREGDDVGVLLAGQFLERIEPREADAKNIP